MTAVALLATMQLWAQKKVEVVNIENEAVRAYMADGFYETNSDYRVTVVKKYYNTALYGQSLDWPAGKLVEWKPASAASELREIRISVSEDRDFRDAWTHNPDGLTSSSYVIRNMIPGRTYFYKVEEFRLDGSTVQVAGGMFRTEGQVRMIQVKGSRNVRDIGGWMTQYGKRVRYGRLYRSASLDAMKPAGRHDFAGNLGVAAELDLRKESNLKQSRLGADKDLMVLAHDAGTKGVQNNKSLYRRDLKWIIDRMKEGKNVEWHCAIGCDRCGTVSFMIEGLLGVKETDLCRDFELSSFSGRHRPRAHVSGMIKHIKSAGGGDTLAQSFYNYWLQTGMSREELDWFINEMLEDDAEDLKVEK